MWPSPTSMCSFPKGSALDRSAARNATTVYTGVTTFPMLPLVLSTDRTSLGPDQDRLAVVLEYTVASDGSTTNGTVYRALVRNHAQLAYDSVGAWLAGAGPAPARVASNDALAAQLRLQHAAAQSLRQSRLQRGALELETIEAGPIMDDGHVIELRSSPTQCGTRSHRRLHDRGQRGRRDVPGRKENVRRSVV